MTILVLPLPVWPPPIVALFALAVWFVCWVTFAYRYDIPRPRVTLPRSRGEYVGRHRAVDPTDAERAAADEAEARQRQTSRVPA